jgi:hypothetical protein
VIRTALVCVWIGPLPAHFPLWLASCARNHGIDWFLVTDQPVAGPLPANVHVVAETLDAIRARFSAEAGFDVSLERPYKLCDLRPLWHVLVPDFDRFDWWGWCDLDVIWGRVAPFFAEHAARYDRLLSEGHLALFRRSPATLNLYRDPASPWRDVFTTARNIGFDEHHGLNLLWIDSGWPLLFRGALVADILPEFARFRTLPRYRNDLVQAFAYRDGRVVREYRAGGATREQEYLYIHFQKRPMPVHVAPDARDYFIGPAGFTPHPGRTPTRAELIAANPPVRPTLAGFRSLVRDWRRRRRTDDPFRAIDRPRQVAQ